MPITAVTNQFSEATVENPVEIPVETRRIARRRAVAVRFALGNVRCDKPFEFNYLRDEYATRATNVPARGERSFFFHTDKRFCRLHLTPFSPGFREYPELA